MCKLLRLEVTNLLNNKRSKMLSSCNSDLTLYRVFFLRIFSQNSYKLMSL